MKKVFLDNLPIKKGKGRYIDWKNSVGYKVDFVYEDIKGELKIIDYNGMYLTIEKNNNFFDVVFVLALHFKRVFYKRHIF